MKIRRSPPLTSGASGARPRLHSRPGTRCQQSPSKACRLPFHPIPGSHDVGRTFHASLLPIPVRSIGTVLYLYTLDPHTLSPLRHNGPARGVGFLLLCNCYIGCVNFHGQNACLEYPPSQAFQTSLPKLRSEVHGLSYLVP